MTTLRCRLILTLILALYFALGVLFAVATPAWQAPDEPAHYNYVRYLAEKGSFPVLHMGDYPHAYLEEIKSRKFPPDLSIDPIRYEFHQPPLYYALAAPIYGLAAGDPLALRLFSVMLGAGVVLLAYAIARRALPSRPALALATAAFVAFLPQHLATVSQVGNDVLAELLYAAVLYVLVTRVISKQEVKKQYTSGHTLQTIGLGLLLGLILITKTTAYIAVPLAGGVLIWQWRQERAGLRRILAEGATVVFPAALIALPWYARDIAVYGWPDFLGLNRHDEIVVGQLRAADFLAQQGWQAYWLRAGRDTFRSFWGQFGWMGVVLDSRVYFALLLLSGVTCGGLVLRAIDRRLRLTPAIVLLGTACLLTLLVYAWYNTQFLQHQGRYLFTALIPIAVFFSLGWEGALRPRASRVLAATLIGVGCGLAAWGLLTGSGLPKWPLALTAALAAGLAVRPWLPRRLDPWLFALPFGALPLLGLYALFGGIVPQLAR